MACNPILEPQNCSTRLPEMSVDPEETCLLCPTAASALVEPAVPCFGTTFDPPNAIKYTVAEVLNKHFWFELISDRDANSFVCQPCWRKVDDFHVFFQSVLVLYQSRSSWRPPSRADDAFPVEKKHTVLLANASPTADEDLHYSDCALLDSSEELDDTRHNNSLPNQPPDAPPKRKRGRPPKADRQTMIARDPQGSKSDFRTSEAVLFVKVECPAEMSDTESPATRSRPAANGLASVADVASDDLDVLVAQYFTLQCDLCEAPLPNLTAARSHHQQQHQQRGYLICGCGRRFSRIDAVREHCAFHADASPYKCIECSKIFCSAARMARHRSTKHPDDGMPAADTAETAAQNRRRRQQDDELLRRHMTMVCSECGSAYATFADAMAHHRREHAQNGYVECCDRKFATRTQAVQHCQWHENPRRFECTQCQQSFQHSRSLQDHMTRMHPGPEAASAGFQCDQCERHCQLIGQLRSHQLRVHTPASERKFECYQCHRSFAVLTSLRIHLRTHDREPTHVCDVCAKMFKTKATYELHYALEHGTVSLKRQCPECGKWLKHANMLRRHLLLHRGKPATCAECGHRAPNDKALYVHRRKRHRGPTHQCLVCSKWFKRLHTLREHMAIHAGITDLYTCVYCPKTFRSTANMYKHRRQVHAEQALADKIAAQRASDERNAAEAAEADAIEAARRLADREAAMRLKRALHGGGD